MRDQTPGPTLESCIEQHITDDGSAIIPPRVARSLEKRANITEDIRIRVRHSDPEAYVALVALHLAAMRSESGTNHADPQPNSEQSKVWMSTTQAAKALGVTDRCIRKRCKTGQIPAVLAGGRWLINRTALALQGMKESHPDEP